ncbi:Na+/H+ antiporter subunit E [Ponticoccus sp. SC2-23]|uniref:Na+/H+ antiporter subunit E n=1 Tax=Alexandriicola marinus TaxID=2081710 RepID=UPI000FD75532|nr:Na+/H+ antiporter subunit E [Alexandriicola marinus]MBM1218962.1 Na+/H+ antiporter subunit E [Ponticoccus sp. SC6-9]MBM1223966.1 Na+/H+ antiporter subunit E [Ponticoccus sp. SC6-15]MBM1230255.1 Na+/H+ antiporter subunit E [Ponticoccus sp. SC6-38]MBM1232932.1 Na+/H+ antiporter subunit E [Ponticoccus sp. SC6-45]MBM1237118.1 Na+/H+ antiporter subunit E [Ponticoccus sp. SC6-49]MBM1241943.1 Na+/H+ antiporter subunit E [Ponticoccus sp. SC2-64]MBM1246456.1 Na+/H+ antiporter subunit E [Ponticoccu
MIRRLIPHPLLSLTLGIVWLALVNKVTVGNVVLATFLGLAVPMITAPYWPDRPRIQKPFAVVEYFLVVLWDIVVANIEVAAIILFRRKADLKSQWIVIPLELTSAEAITVLAGTITMTPGTVSATLSADAGSILVHCLHTETPDEVRDTIKSRYERRLKEIFV